MLCTGISGRAAPATPSMPFHDAPESVDFHTCVPPKVAYVAYAMVLSVGWKATDETYPVRGRAFGH